MAMLRKIDRMHEIFGVLEGEKCKNCYHLLGEKGTYRKCEIYGDTASEATDWALSWTACKMWNNPYCGDIPVIKGTKRYKEEAQVPGQMSLAL